MHWYYQSKVVCELGLRNQDSGMLLATACHLRISNMWEPEQSEVPLCLLSGNDSHLCSVNDLETGTPRLVAET